MPIHLSPRPVRALLRRIKSMIIIATDVAHGIAAGTVILFLTIGA